MAGLPQLREAAWLYGDDPVTPLALVRLFEHRDGSGRWQVRVNVNDPQPGEEPSQVVDYADEPSARNAVARLYAAGEADGRWRIRQPDGY